MISCLLWLSLTVIAVQLKFSVKIEDCSGDGDGDDPSTRLITLFVTC
jgi:hypothetical protein